jgi:UDP-MurNAc hydroxylase
VKTDDPSMLIYRSREDYMVEFVNTARVLNARYAIPFASSHCFLHKDVFHFNEGAVSPEEIKRYFDEHKPAGSDCVVMLAGDEKGFLIQPQDWFSNRDEHLSAYLEAKRSTLEAQYALEDRVELPFRAFQRYFQAEIDSLPRLSRVLFKPRVVFELKDRPGVHWVIDYDRRTVYEAASRPEGYALCVLVPTLILKDCIYKRMFATFSASKRLSIEIPRGHHLEFMIFFNLLNMYEHEYFPLRRLLRWRFIRVWLRRWREVWEYVGLLFGLALRRGDPLAKFVPKIDAGSSSL